MNGDAAKASANIVKPAPQSAFAGKPPGSAPAPAAPTIKPVPAKPPSPVKQQTPPAPKAPAALPAAAAAAVSKPPPPPSSPQPPQKSMDLPANTIRRSSTPSPSPQVAEAPSVPKVVTTTTTANLSSKEPPPATSNNPPSGKDTNEAAQPAAPAAAPQNSITISLPNGSEETVEVSVNNLDPTDVPVNGNTDGNCPCTYKHVTWRQYRLDMQLSFTRIFTCFRWTTIDKCIYKRNKRDSEGKSGFQEQNKGQKTDHGHGRSHHGHWMCRVCC